MRNQTTKLLFLSMLREGCNNNFISGLLEDGVNIMDAIMHKRIVLKDNHDLPDGTRRQLECCIKNWDLAEARRHFWQMLEEKIPVREE